MLGGRAAAAAGKQEPPVKPRKERHEPITQLPSANRREPNRRATDAISVGTSKGVDRQPVAYLASCPVDSELVRQVFTTTYRSRNYDAKRRSTSRIASPQ